jgi:hypothetical protein
MRTVLMVISLTVCLGAWAVGAWASSYTIKGGPQELYRRPWLLDSSMFSALVKEANERDYYRIKHIAILVFGLSLLAFALIAQLPTK